MKLSQLSPLVKRGKKRLGRGYGSGKGGHTAGRGQKGQKSRRNVPIYFTSGAMGASLIKQLPYLRGKGKFKSKGDKPFVINTGVLNSLPDKTIVSVKSLIQYKLVPQDLALRNGVKILGGGELTKVLTVTVPVSKGARLHIEKAGGTIGIHTAKKVKPVDRKTAK